MSVDLIKLQGDLTDKSRLIADYITIFEASDGIGSAEPQKLKKMQDQIKYI